ncbi:MAG: LysE family translocator [Verrucomicrobiota bacterium JB023]|nr:LysE family translocator [Verrucomicrobiota bacterium JB023]
MTLLEALSLTLVMLTLAALPSASVLLVVTRAATHGTKSGAAVAGGIVLADLLFVTLAILGMSALAERMGSLFSIVKMAGGAYLMWLGLGLIRAQETGPAASPANPGGALWTSFAAGFFLTLGDLKAILFYAALFPTVVDMKTISAPEIAAIMLVTIGAVGGVKLLYAFAAERIAGKLHSKAANGTRKVSGCLLMGAGGYLISKS